jgi:putative flippase GtrA
MFTSRRFIWFVGIGGASTLVHLTVVALLVNLSMQPLVANIIAFLCAFNVSFFGHRNLTFAKLQDDKQLQLPHFFLVAVTSGFINEYLYYLFLHYTHLNYMLALLIVVSLVACFTFTASRFWACR